MKTLVVNLFAGPGTGKSTSCAQLFSELKWNGIVCEMALEFAKDKVWEESFKVLDNQIYIFGKQLHRMKRLENKVDIIITDSPLLFSLIYDKSKNEDFKNLVISTHKSFNNYNVFLTREKEYKESGRLQKLNDAKLLDLKILNMLDEAGESYSRVRGNKESITKLSELIVKIRGELTKK